MPKTVLIAESNKFFLTSLSSSISLLGFAVVGEISKLSDIDDLALKNKPDLLVVDLHLSRTGMAGLAHLKHLKKHLPQMKILVLGLHDVNDEFKEAILDAGFDGFWNKSESRAEFIRTLNSLFPDFSKPTS